MFNKDAFINHHAVNANTGFHYQKNIYDGYVSDAEGKQWGWIKSLNLYEQAETGIRKDPAQFQLMNIDILGYGSNDGDGPTTTTTAATDYTTGADGIFEFLSDGALDTPKDFSIVTNSTAYPVDGGIGDPKLLRVQLTSTSVINLQEGAGIFANISPAPPFIGLFVSGPLGDRGWYIAEFDSAGNYNYVRSGKGTSFPPIDRSLDQPLAVVFYATDPGSVGTWSDYTT